jgi:hypothetical protein
MGDPIVPHARLTRHTARAIQQQRAPDIARMAREHAPCRAAASGLMCGLGLVFLLILAHSLLSTQTPSSAPRALEATPPAGRKFAAPVGDPHPSVLEYAPTWSDVQHRELARTMVATATRVCGEAYFRQHRTDLGEYLVYCTPDSRTWYAYRMWPATRTVVGPYRAQYLSLPYRADPCIDRWCRDTSWHQP